jgi:hypothetical protein
MRLVAIEEAAVCLASPLSQLPPTLEVVLLRTLRFLQRRLRMLSQDSSLRVTGRRLSTLDSGESTSLVTENNTSTLPSIEVDTTDLSSRLSTMPSSATLVTHGLVLYE